MDYKQIGIIGLPAGLQKSRKILKAEQEIELQFKKICKQIQLDCFKDSRSIKQKENRQRKRK